MNRTVGAIVVGCILGAVGYFVKCFNLMPESYSNNRQVALCMLVCAMIGGLLELWREEVKDVRVVGVRSSPDAMTYYVFPKRKTSKKTAKPFMVITTKR